MKISPNYRRHHALLFTSLLLTTLIGACSSAPKVSQAKLSQSEAKDWLNHYCSVGNREVTGDLVIRANTKEFKGQYPASLHFEKTGEFTLEATNILGGTILRMTSDGKTIQILSPSKPQYNRSGITHYLGLELSILTQLLRGDLPCPAERNQMRFESGNWVWNFEKAEGVPGVPARVTLVPKGISDPKLRIDLVIEEWDQEHHYAKKVSVKGPEGELKWTWRNRN